MVHENGLHILAANVQNKGNLIVDLPGCQIVGNGFNDAGFQVESGFDQVFPVAC